MINFNISELLERISAGGINGGSQGAPPLQVSMEAPPLAKVAVEGGWDFYQKILNENFS